MASKIVRRLGIIVGVLVLLIALTGASMYVMSGRALSRKYPVAAESLTIPTDFNTIERGKHLVTGRLVCVDCHANDLGGRVVIDGMPFARIVASNLTGGGVGARYTDADWVRALRHGVRPDSTSLIFMPSDVFTHLSAADLTAVIAYIKSVPPVTRQLPSTELGPVGRMLVATNKAPLVMARLIDHEAPIPAMPQEGETTEYGGYLVASGGCYVCHGAALSGGKFAGSPDDPPGTNITPTGIGSWTRDDFLRAFRTGKRPNGTAINPFMPWPTMGKMTDTELGAIYSFLKTVPAKSYMEN